MKKNTLQNGLKNINKIITRNTEPRDFKYFDTAISDWHSKGLSNAEEIQTYLSSVKDKDKRIKQIENKTLTYNYTQSTFDNLESLYDN